jgi:RNA polymerase subunit RPABC4/transcription elongation factor Spt4
MSDYRPCPQCSAIMSPGQRICHECGHELERKSRVHFIDGELSEEGIARQAVDTRAQMQRLYLELRWIAQERGYKPGWAFMKLKHEHNFTAPYDWLNLAPIEPSAATLRLVKSWQIAYAKRRRAA